MIMYGLFMVGGCFVQTSEFGLVLGWVMAKLIVEIEMPACCKVLSLLGDML